jgi:hypothetical protein
MPKAADTFIIVYLGAAGFEAKIRLFDGGGMLTGQGFKDEASAREWVAKHAPDAKEVNR